MINEFFKCIDNNDFKTAKEVLRKWNPQNDELVDCQIHLAKLLAQKDYKELHSLASKFFLS